MSLQQVPSSLREIIGDVLEVSPTEVTPNLSQDSVEMWDSFRHLQLILALEEEYGVQFDPQQIPELTTVAKIQATLEQKGAKIE